MSPQESTLIRQLKALQEPQVAKHLLGASQRPVVVSLVGQRPPELREQQPNQEFPLLRDPPCRPKRHKKRLPPSVQPKRSVMEHQSLARVLKDQP